MFHDTLNSHEGTEKTGTFEVKLNQSSLMLKIVCGRKDCWQDDLNPQTLFDTLIFYVSQLVLCTEKQPGTPKVSPTTFTASSC